MNQHLGGARYWLDTGNRANDGQVVLGQVPSRRRVTDDKERLPHIGELYPEMIDPAAEDPDEGPSCSLAEALERQSLFINTTVSDFAMNLLWLLLTQGHIDTHGAFINMERMMVTPLRVDPAVWERFGVQRDGRRRKVVRPSVAAKKSKPQRHSNQASGGPSRPPGATPRQHWKAASGSFPILDVIETAVLSDGIHIAAMPRSSQPSRDTSRWGVFR